MSLTRATSRIDMRTALRGRVVQMYRRMCRLVPSMIKLYDLDHTPAEMRHVIGLLYRKNAHIHDPRLVEMLLAKAEMEMEETMQNWKQRGAVINMLSLDGTQVGEVAEANSQIDNQWWISAMLEAVEMQTGETIDQAAASKVIDAAKRAELGQTPGEELAPASGEPVERFFRAKRTGKNDFLDKFLAGTEHDIPASPNSRSRVQNTPQPLSQLRERNAQDKSFSREQLRHFLLTQAAADQQGQGPFIRPPKKVAGKDIPLWMATKVQYPWIDESLSCDDPRVTAAIEEAQDELEARYRDEVSHDSTHERVFAQQREQNKDAYRLGRAY